MVGPEDGGEQGEIQLDTQWKQPQVASREV